MPRPSGKPPDPEPTPDRRQGHQAPQHPASPAYITHVLDPAGVRTKTLRSTRLVDLLISLDPKLVAEALGMNADGLLAYIADGVDPDRLAASNL